MSVIGIDFGNESCYIAVARQGGIETIANDYSLRSTSSCVAFGEKNRILGVAAKNQLVTNMKNTCLNFKRLIGKNYRDPRIQEELKCLPYRVVEQKDGSIGITVTYLKEEHIFSPTQITAMLFTKLKNTAEVALGIKIVDVVIGVPCYYDDAERHSMIEAATIAGLNVLRLMNETTAVALAYGIYKQDLPGPEEKPRNVIFVDCGHSHLQVSVVAFNKGKLKMLTTYAQAHLGGRDFDLVLGDKFAADFKTKYKLDVKANPRAWLRLLAEVEKLKKQMSANSTELPMNIECFMNDIDVSGTMKRVDMEAMCAHLFKQLESTLSQSLADSGLKLDDISSVEIVGGSSRVPGIKTLIEKIFKIVPSTTLNADEAVARGCALQCAMLSPTFKVREFSVTDVQPYSIKLIWQDDSGLEADMEVFPRNHQVPFSKMLTFYRKQPFVLQAQYSHPSPNPDPLIGHFTVNDVVPNADGENQKVKVKVRVNIHGLFTVASATFTEKRDVVEEENTPSVPMEVDEKEKNLLNGPDNGDQPDSTEGDEKSNESQEQRTETGKANNEDAESVKPEAAEKKPKKVMKTIDLSIASLVKSIPIDQLNSLTEIEGNMNQEDKLENERINAKNAVEEYVYDLRNKIYAELEKYIDDGNRSLLSKLLDETESWLYEGGEDCSKQVYIDKLGELKKLGEPIKQRRYEREELPGAFENLLSAIHRAFKVTESFRRGDEKFGHLDTAEVEKVEKAMKERREWVDKYLNGLAATPLNKDFSVTVQQVRSEKGTFEAVVNPIINKPKPKPKVEEPPPSADKETDKKGDGTENGPSDNPSDPQGGKTSDGTMDVD